MIIDENTTFDYSTTEDEFNNSIRKLKDVVICEKCGAVNKHKNIYDADGIIVTKICLSCGKKNAFRSFSKEEIVESFRLFKLFRRTSIINGVEIGFIPIEFQIKFGGVFKYKLSLPYKNGNKEIITKMISTRDLSVGNIENCFFILYLKENAIDFRRFALKGEESIGKITDVIGIFFSNDSKFSYDNRSNYSLSVFRTTQVIENIKNLFLHVYFNPKTYDISITRERDSEFSYNLIDSNRTKKSEISDYFNVYEYFGGTYSDYLMMKNNSDTIDFFFSYDYSKKADELLYIFERLNVKVERLENIISNDPTINIKVQAEYRNIDLVFYVYYSLLKSGFHMMRVLGVPVEDLFRYKAIKVESISSSSREIERISYLVHLLERYHDCDQGELSVRLIDTYSPFIVKKDFFGRSLFNLSEDVSSNKSNSVYATYLTLIAIRLGFNSSDDFYESEKYQEMKKEYFSLIKEYKQDLGKSRRKWKNELQLYTIAQHYYPSTIHQFTISKNPLIITDIYISELNTIIEYNGLQHYENVPFTFKNDDSKFDKQLIRDSNLRITCNERGINLIEWPYNLEVTPFNFLILLNKLYLINE